MPVVYDLLHGQDLRKRLNETELFETLSSLQLNTCRRMLSRAAPRTPNSNNSRISTTNTLGRLLLGLRSIGRKVNREAAVRGSLRTGQGRRKAQAHRLLGLSFQVVTSRHITPPVNSFIFFAD
jgi:hypothetical protein